MPEQNQIRGGFYAVANLFDVQIPLPVDVAPDIRIERPTKSQLQTIRDLLANAQPMRDLRNDFEGRWEEEGSGRFRYFPLPESEWRYLVLTHSGTNVRAHYFLEVANLVEPAFGTLLSVMTSEEFGRGMRMGYGFDSLRAERRSFATQFVRNAELLDQAAIERMRAALSAFERFDRIAHPGVWRAVELFSLFTRLPLANFLDVLTFFMLIEMLLTHNPGDKEVGDSLSHQIRQKVPFAFARMGERIDYSCFIPDLSAEKAWTLLYRYRSAVAHGDVPEFERSLSALKDARTADQFLMRVTRKLLRHAMDDPHLFEGLKPI